MNTSSQWRIALAERISQPYSQHPQAKAVMVVGSVAYGWADRFSDIDLSVVWDTLPDASDRAALIERIGGVPEGSGDAFYVCGDMSKGVRVDVGHTTQAEVEQVLKNLQQRPAEVRTKQALLSGLQQAIP
jgi:predicted nucleotidyltransferase